MCPAPPRPSLLPRSPVPAAVNGRPVQLRASHQLCKRLGPPGGSALPGRRAAGQPVSGLGWAVFGSDLRGAAHSCQDAASGCLPDRERCPATCLQVCIQWLLDEGHLSSPAAAKGSSACSGGSGSSGARHAVAGMLAPAGAATAPGVTAALLHCLMLIVCRLRNPFPILFVNVS